MMPKSTATRRPSRVDEKISGMHVGMEKAVAQRLREEAADDEHWRCAWDRARPRPAPRDRATACRRSIRVVRTRAAVRLQSTSGTRKSRDRLRVRSASSEAAAASMRRSSSMATDSRQRVDHGASARSRRPPAKKRSARRAANAKAERSRANSASMPGRSTFTATRTRRFVGGLRFVHLRDRRRRHRLAEARLNTASSGRPKATLRSPRARFRVGNGGKRSCRLLKRRRDLVADDDRAASPAPGRA